MRRSPAPKYPPPSNSCRTPTYPPRPHRCLRHPHRLWASAINNRFFTLYRRYLLPTPALSFVRRHPYSLFSAGALLRNVPAVFAHRWGYLGHRADKYRGDSVVPGTAPIIWGEERRHRVKESTSNDQRIAPAKGDSEHGRSDRDSPGGPQTIAPAQHERDRRRSANNTAGARQQQAPA